MCRCRSCGDIRKASRERRHPTGIKRFGAIQAGLSARISCSGCVAVRSRPTTRTRGRVASSTRAPGAPCPRRRAGERDILAILSRLPRFSPDDIRVVVRHVFHTDADAVSHLPVGWGNENWRASVRGEKYLIKIGPRGSADKWAATTEAYRLAREAGVPVPDVLHFDAASDLVDGCV